MNTVATEVANITGTRERFVSTAFETEHSNFRFLDEFAREKQIGPHSPPLVRIFSLARKLGFRGLLVDRINCAESPFLTEENQILAKNKDIGYTNSEAYKFSFFSEEEDRITPASCLGYAVLKIDRCSQEKNGRQYVFESVLTPPRNVNQNCFLHCQSHYRVANSLGCDFEVSGSLYAQQSQHGFVCAHVALRTVLSSVLPAGDITYGEIAKFAGKRGGLGPDEIEQVFKGLKIQCKKESFEPCPHNPTCKSKLHPKYLQELYGFTESGCPALLGFELANGGRHIVPVVGHTFNEDSWVPHSNQGYFELGKFRFFSSELWLGSHLMHDDNFGPYYCLPRQFLTADNFRLLYGISLRKPALFSRDAEVYAIDFFSQMVANWGASLPNDTWTNLFIAFASKKRLVLRAVYLSKDEYLNHIRQFDSSGDNDTITEIAEVLPNHHFWMVEASMPELFSVSRKKFGEIILFPNGDDVSFDPGSFVCMRLPGCLFVQNKEDCSKWHFRNSSMIGHTSLFQRSSTRDTLYCG